MPQHDLKAVQKQTAQYDLFNRLHSISSDEKFVRRITDEFDGRFPVVANQRCGTWYCDSSSSASVHAYFKSTDGHHGEWNFNMRRANLPLASYAQKNGGMILVDSTRRGKRMPDALSKTVPIWCCVINRALAKRRSEEGLSTQEWDGNLYLPPNVVGESERDQIEERIDGWANQLRASSIDLPDLQKPLRPFWIHPSTTQIPHIPSDPPCIPIICVSASRWVGAEDDVPLVTSIGNKRTVGFSYVQGAGDDDELWSKGLTPKLFYEYRDRLLEADRDDLPGVVEDTMMESATQRLDGMIISQTGQFNLTQDHTVGVPNEHSKLGLAIGYPSTSQPNWQRRSYHTIRIIPLDKSIKVGGYTWPVSSDSSVFACPSARADSTSYFLSLDDLINHVEDLLETETEGILMKAGSPNQLKAIMDRSEESDTPFELPEDTTFDASTEKEMRQMIIPLALLLLLAIPDISELAVKKLEKDENDERQERGEIMDKAKIAKVLHQLLNIWPDGNPPRAALRRINEYLMSPDR